MAAFDRMELKRRDRDFDKWDVAVRGDVVNHDLVVSADVNTGTLVLKKTNGDGFPVNKKGEIDEDTKETIEHHRDDLQVVPRRLPDEEVPEDAVVVGGIAVEAPVVEEETHARHSHRTHHDS